MVARLRSRFTLPRILLLVMVAMWAALPLSPAAAATQHVYMVSGDKFTPKTLSVLIGTTVKWTNADSEGHTATADSHLFNSHNLAPGQSFRFTFNRVGTFRYYCQYHGAPGGVGMSGTIVVHR